MITQPHEQWLLSEVDTALLPAYQVLRLLLAERRTGRQYANLLMALDQFLLRGAVERDARNLAAAAEAILRSERVSIEAAPGVWGALQSSIAIRWPSWARFVAWCRGRPHFPT
jgi:hypothetical protein